VSTTTDDVQLWYHTLDLPNRPPTNGWFDLRETAKALPWPEVKGLRCLDIATYDGFYAFEMERRGAASVVATDISDHSEWDWPIMLREQGGEEYGRVVGEKGAGFEHAHAILGSTVEKIERNVYDLSPERDGTFDVVVCGSLLLHLRDPVRAIEAIRSVCSGVFMSVEAVSLRLSKLFPNKPMAELGDRDVICQWWIANTAGHRRMLEAGGFEVVSSRGVFAVPFGPAHPFNAERKSPKALGGHLLRSAAMRGEDGVPHAVALAKPR
jgi:SAM-dependent methyltransferase